MKKIIFFGFLILSTFCFSQKKEMMEAIKNRQPDKALEIGNKLLETDPNSFETNFLFAKAYNEKNDFNNALIFIDKANNRCFFSGINGNGTLALSITRLTF